MKYWIFKSEPDVYSIDDLAKDKKACWEGVRNYQVRNFMRDDMKVGDMVYFYHSNAKEIGIVGVCKVVKEAYPDYYAWDKKSKYFDAKSSKENPRWLMVDVEFIEKFDRVITLAELKENKKLENLPIVRKGNRLSIVPIEKKEFTSIKQML
jgi:predicted RNA-binding protein with PUA-like domain